MKNRYGGLPDVSGEEAFLEQLAQCLAILKLRLGKQSIVGDFDDGDKLVILTKGEYESLVRSSDRACHLFHIRRAEVQKDYVKLAELCAEEIKQNGMLLLTGKKEAA